MSLEFDSGQGQVWRAAEPKSLVAPVVFARLTQEHLSRGQECIDSLDLELSGRCKHLVFENDEAFEPLPRFIG